jgi:hypothetical protein
MNRFYTGIGSRDTPAVILQVFERVAEVLAKKGYILRSGGADGADTAFEKGCIAAGGEKEIYLPWSGFNGRSEKEPGYFYTRDSHYEMYSKAKVLAQGYHPVWDTLKDSVKMLHTRNVHQVLGLNVESPSDFLICYSTINIHPIDGVQWRGGTGQALRIAQSLGIPFYNFADDNSAAECVKMLKAI